MIEMPLSEEEAAVVMVMRSSDMAGRAVYGYAMRFDDEAEWDPSMMPYTHG